jgi:hypothetical protein
MTERTVVVPKCRMPILPRIYCRTWDIRADDDDADVTRRTAISRDRLPVFHARNHIRCSCCTCGTCRRDFQRVLVFELCAQLTNFLSVDTAFSRLLGLSTCSVLTVPGMPIRI